MGRTENVSAEEVLTIERSIVGAVVIGSISGFLNLDCCSTSCSCKEMFCRWSIVQSKFVQLELVYKRFYGKLYSLVVYPTHSPRIRLNYVLCVNVNGK